MSLHHSNEFSSMLGREGNYCSIHLFCLFLLILALFWLISSLDIVQKTEALLMTQVRCVAYLDYLVPVMAGISHQAASLPHSLSENWPFLCTMCYNGAGWSLLWPRTDTALQPGLGIVMKHTLKTDHMDMWFRCEKGCIMHIHETCV